MKKLIVFLLALAVLSTCSMFGDKKKDDNQKMLLLLGAAAASGGGATVTITMEGVSR